MNKSWPQLVTPQQNTSTNTNRNINSLLTISTHTAQQTKPQDHKCTLVFTTQRKTNRQLPILQMH